MGFFISFEGGEGGGKTTQINRLAQSLTQAGHKVITTREPGGTEEGDKIREFIVQREGGNWSPMAETLLLLAARAMHVERVIAPALAGKKIVISDRFIDSTAAYQGYGRGLDLKVIDSLHKTVLGGVRPDLTFILDIAPDAGLKRSKHRLETEQFDDGRAEDRFERLDLSFHEKIRQGFLEIAKKDKARCVVIDASRPVGEIAVQIEKTVFERLK